MDLEAKPLLLLWWDILVIGLWKCAAYGYHLEILLMVMILEVIILVGQNVSRLTIIARVIGVLELTQFS
jgi:hypothetical protein